MLPSTLTYYVSTLLPLPGISAHKCLSLGSLITNMVKMDEHFLHSNYLVCGATRELGRRFRRERMEGRLKMILEGKMI